MENFELFIALLVLIIAGVLLLKKMAGCLMRTVITIILLAIFIGAAIILRLF